MKVGMVWFWVFFCAYAVVQILIFVGSCWYGKEGRSEWVANMRPDEKKR